MIKSSKQTSILHLKCQTLAHKKVGALKGIKIALCYTVLASLCAGRLRGNRFSYTHATSPKTPISSVLTRQGFPVSRFSRLPVFRFSGFLYLRDKILRFSGKTEKP
jgi:hypothetical protein